MDRTTWILVALVGVGALIVLFFVAWDDAPEPVPAEEVAEAAPAPVVEETLPAPPPVSETEPPVPTVPVQPPIELPELDDSDPEVRSALSEAVGDGPVESFLVPAGIVRKIVVTVDNLSNDKVAMRLRAVRPVAGSFAAAGNPDAGYTLDPDNFARYVPFVRTLEAVETERLAALYFRYYPLLQSAYEELGYPGRQFHARVIAVIDDLLAAPEVTGPIGLARPKVMYEFSDPELEVRSAGQKMMIRMGPDNAGIVKARLRELRRVLTAQPGAG